MCLCHWPSAAGYRIDCSRDPADETLFTVTTPSGVMTRNANGRLVAPAPDLFARPHLQPEPSLPASVLVATSTSASNSQSIIPRAASSVILPMPTGPAGEAPSSRARSTGPPQATRTLAAGLSSIR